MASKNLPEETREGEAVQREKWERPTVVRLQARSAEARHGSGHDGGSMSKSLAS